MISEVYIRKEVGVVNTDVSAFKSAKARIEQTKKMIAERNEQKTTAKKCIRY